jgi:hypothetical protein
MANLRNTSLNQAALDLIQSEHPNYHPLVSLARLAHSADVKADPRLELEVHRTILPYVTPKLSSVEVTIEKKEERRVTISLFEERVLENGQVVDVEVPLITDVTDVVPLDR